MTTAQWFVFFLIIQVIHFLGTWKLYIKAGRKSWEAIIPVYNAIILMKIINRPVWWVILLFVPVINLVVFPVIWVETLRSFGKNTTSDTILGVISCGFYIYYTNYTEEVIHIKNRSLKPKNQTADLISSLLFAVVVATVVHTYLIQPFTIPSSSLEKTLLVGDFLFVSKFHYGARTPMTAVALPMVHDTIPLANTKSYFKKPQLPFFRFPGFQNIKRNDIVVFNWPVDTVRFFRDTKSIGIRKPIDKKSNYVKRCVGLPGDSLTIKSGDIYINGQKLILPERAKPEISYTVMTDGSTPLNGYYLKKELKITDFIGQVDGTTYYIQSMTEETAQRLRNYPGIKKVEKVISNEGDTNLFPYNKNWNIDNYGPIYIPKKGETVTLNTASLPFYKMIITEYEKNDLQINGDEIKINGQVANSYTFRQNYYWMMGDNRHNSEDSRTWGFVPNDHIVGKPIFIWLSLDSNEKGLNKIRWERMFTTVEGDGQPQSYLKYFLILVAIGVGLDYLFKRKNKI